MKDCLLSYFIFIQSVEFDFNFVALNLPSNTIYKTKIDIRIPKIHNLKIIIRILIYHPSFTLKCLINIYSCYITIGFFQKS